MTLLAELLASGEFVAAHRPWPRAIVDTAIWLRAAEGLAAGEATLLGLWAEPGTVHMALLETVSMAVAVLSLNASSGRFPSIGRLHAPAIRLERTIRDLYGIVPEDAPDTRPWLDHGRWHGDGDAPPYPFLPVEGESLHQISVGPVHAGIIEPGHFRFTAQGETVVRLEERLGYVHKGVERLMAGASLERAAMLAGRVSGDSTVAYGFAFARAVEAALNLAPPPRAVWLRALMAELERLANHFGDVGAICNDAAFALMHAQCGALRERVLRAADTAFGHRLMRDCILPGGVAVDLSREGAAAIKALVAEARRLFPKLAALYDDTPTLQERTVGTGRLTAELARRFGAGGYVGRASGRSFDVRRALPYAPYDTIRFQVAGRTTGDVNARVWVRIEEVGQSLALIDEIITRLPDGPLRAAPGNAGDGEGMALVEGFRGDVLIWLSLERGLVARCHLRDPSWFQWPLLEAVIEGNIVADFPLCNKSFNCSYSGHDL